MVVDLPVAHVGTGPGSAHAARQDGMGLLSVVPVMAEGHINVAREREWRLTIALALEQLPSGACLVVRDASGREWSIGPAGQAVARSLREAA